MHELGVLLHAVKTVNKVALNNSINHVRHITLEVGEESGYVPAFLHKLFPVAIDSFPVMAGCRLKTEMVPGSGLIIKEIGY